MGKRNVWRFDRRDPNPKRQTPPPSFQGKARGDVTFGQIERATNVWWTDPWGNWGEWEEVPKVTDIADRLRALSNDRYLIDVAPDHPYSHNFWVTLKEKSSGVSARKMLTVPRLKAGGGELERQVLYELMEDINRIKEAEKKVKYDPNGEYKGYEGYYYQPGGHSKESYEALRKQMQRVQQEEAQRVIDERLRRHLEEEFTKGAKVKLPEPEEYEHYYGRWINEEMPKKKKIVKFEKPPDIAALRKEFEANIILQLKGMFNSDAPVAIFIAPPRYVIGAEQISTLGYNTGFTSELILCDLRHFIECASVASVHQAVLKAAKPSTITLNTPYGEWLLDMKEDLLKGDLEKVNEAVMLMHLEWWREHKLLPA